MLAIDNDAIEAAKNRFHTSARKLFYTHDDYIKNVRRVNDEHYGDFYLGNVYDHEFNLYTIFIPAFFKAQKEYTNLVTPLIGVHDFECMEIVNSWHEFMLEAANLIRNSARDANICTNNAYEDE
jgi:hypothetical protein